MESGKLVKYEEGDTVYREFNECDEEYEFIAKRIKALHDSGVNIQRWLFCFENVSMDRILPKCLTNMRYRTLLKA